MEFLASIVILVMGLIVFVFGYLIIRIFNLIKEPVSERINYLHHEAKRKSENSKPQNQNATTIVEKELARRKLEKFTTPKPQTEYKITSIVYDPKVKKSTFQECHISTDSSSSYDSSSCYSSDCSSSD